MSRCIWRHHSDPHCNVEILRPPEGQGLYIMNAMAYGEVIRAYLSEDALSGLSRAIQKELELRRAGRSEE